MLAQRLESMPLHDCKHKFPELAATALPAHMARLRSAMGDPRPMSAFARAGVGVASLLKEFQLHQDFSGCYVLLEKSQPINVGISRCVIRLKQHVCGKTHFDASLAFQIALRRHHDKAVAALTRRKPWKKSCSAHHSLRRKNIFDRWRSRQSQSQMRLSCMSSSHTAQSSWIRINGILLRPINGLPSFLPLPRGHYVGVRRRSLGTNSPPITSVSAAASWLIS
jgi:hypothetical protein